jgi:hypothetical protein
VKCIFESVLLFASLPIMLRRGAAVKCAFESVLYFATLPIILRTGAEVKCIFESVQLPHLCQYCYEQEQQ